MKMVIEILMNIYSISESVSQDDFKSIILTLKNTIDNGKLYS